MPSKLIKVKPRQLIIGDKVPYNVYTPKRVLLLAKGELVESKTQQKSLLAVGYIDPDEKQLVRDGKLDVEIDAGYIKAANAFASLDAMYLTLAHLVEQLDSGTKPYGFANQIYGLTEELLKLAKAQENTLLGAANWPQEVSQPTLAASLKTAAFLAVVVEKLDLTLAEKQATLAAALTANLSVLDLQDKLINQQQPLSNLQKSRLQAHPNKSAFLLESLGVTDVSWLTGVKQHHERLDGSGYPEQLIERNIGVPARLIALADTYLAMTHWRPYRALLSSRQAMRELLGEEQTQLDKKLAKALLAQLGIYPPASLVQLANGDTAVVIEKGLRLDQPLVAVIANAAGKYLMPPPKRDTSQEGLHIVKLLSQEPLKKMQPFLFWDIQLSRKA